MNKEESVEIQIKRLENLKLQILAQNPTACFGISLPNEEQFTKEDFKHETDHKWTDISSEQYRCYEFSDKMVRIDKPLWLSVSKSGGHRIWDAAGVSHYIPTGYRHSSWRVKDNQPHFVK